VIALTRPEGGARYCHVAPARQWPVRDVVPSARTVSAHRHKSKQAKDLWRAPTMTQPLGEAASHLHVAPSIPESLNVGFPVKRQVETVDTAAPARPTNGKSARVAGTIDLDRSLAGGIAWTAGVTWGSQILSWVSTLIVVHYLVPTDYGLIGMALLYLGLIQMASEFGVGAAIVRFRDLSSDQIKQFNSLSVIAGSLGLATSIAAAIPLSRFFHEPRLPLVLGVMSSVFLISAFRVVPQALLNRRLQFRKLAVIDGTQSLIGSCLTLTLAILGFGYWALALGFVVSAALYTLLIVVQNPEGFRRPRLASIREPLAFSSHMLFSRFAWYAYSNADFAVIGRLLGGAALGAYTLGWTLSGMTVEKITAVISRVTPAIFCKVQNDLVAIRRYLLLITEGLALVTFPACIGLALIADDFVRSVLGPHWIVAIMPVQLLAIAATYRSLQPLIPQVLFALGQSRLNMHNAILTALVLPVCFAVASRWGIAGVAAAWLIIGPLMFSRLLLRTLRLIDLPVRRYFLSVWPATSGCLLMVCVVVSLKRTFLRGTPPFASLAISVVVGVSAYALTLLAFHRDRLVILREMVRVMRQRQPDAVPESSEPVGAGGLTGRLNSVVMADAGAVS
jgi:teichuronic acid exporter